MTFMTGHGHAASPRGASVVGRTLVLFAVLALLDIGLVGAQNASTIVGDWRGEWRNSLHGVFKGRMRLHIRSVEGREVRGHIAIEDTDAREAEFQGEFADRRLIIPALGIEGTVADNTIMGTGDGSKVITRTVAARGRYSFTLTKQP